MSMAKLIQAINKRGFSTVLRYAFALTTYKLGLVKRLKSPDRTILEEIILPYYAGQEDVSKILFVGTDWFTKYYENIFKGKDYWTIDIAPWKQQFAGRQHIVDALENLSDHFPSNHFDLIICNGVIGWGLNEMEVCNEALNQCYICLKYNGYIVLGWNDIPKYRPVPLENIAALKLFRPFVFPGLGTVRYLASQEERHTFDFYIK